MDSIERMRRINDLTRELKQRGFAESSFEAIKQANQIYGDDELEEHVKHGMIEKSQHERILKEEMNASDETGISSVDKKLSKVNESIDALTNKMNEIIRAINELDSRLTDLKVKQDKLAVLRQEPKPEVKSEPKLESRSGIAGRNDVDMDDKTSHEPKSGQASSKDEYAMNQRTGNFQSQDVSIDKMFYFGKK
ncbi:MAG: hypothetical protein ACP5NW_03510 [Candidatus Woesearchaeota archaeon]